MYACTEVQVVAWGLSGKFGALRPEGCRYKSHFSCHVATLGKSFTHSDWEGAPHRPHLLFSSNLVLSSFFFLLCISSVVGITHRPGSGPYRKADVEAATGWLPTTRTPVLRGTSGESG